MITLPIPINQHQPEDVTSAAGAVILHGYTKQVYTPSPKSPGGAHRYKILLNLELNPLIT
jgi:hypothetical protein